MNDDTIDRAMRAMDAGRRAGWAKAYDAERRLALRSEAGGFLLGMVIALGEVLGDFDDEFVGELVVMFCAAHPGEATLHTHESVERGARAAQHVVAAWRSKDST